MNTREKILTKQINLVVSPEFFGEIHRIAAESGESVSQILRHGGELRMRFLDRRSAKKEGNTDVEKN